MHHKLVDEEIKELSRKYFEKQNHKFSKCKTFLGGKFYHDTGLPQETRKISKNFPSKRIIGKEQTRCKINIKRK